MIKTILGTVLSVALLSAPFERTGFTIHEDGRGAEGVDDVWRGRLDAPDAGVITIRVEHLVPAPAGGPATAGPVHALVFVSCDDDARSFGADVTGTMTATGAMHLTGTVDVGPASGSTVDVTVHVHRHRLDGHGTIRLKEEM